MGGSAAGFAQLGAGGTGAGALGRGELLAPDQGEQAGQVVQGEGRGGLQAQVVGQGQHALGWALMTSCQQP
jgi:hypothetical protein